MRTLLVLLCLPALAHAQAPVTIDLTVASTGAAQTNAPVFTGVPFPPSTLASAAQLDLTLAGSSVPRTAAVLTSWPNGSPRVVLVGFLTTLTAGQTKTYVIRCNSGPGAMSAPIAWTRNLNALALCPPAWYGASGVFGQRFLASADNTLLPAFETRMLAQYDAHGDPPSNTNPDVRNYYDHAHALITTLLRSGGPTSLVQRIWNEVNQYRENEILHSGAYRGQYNAGTVTTNANPIPFNVVRRMFVQGLLEDWYVTGDQRSFDVAKEIADAYLADAYAQGARFTWTERIPGWEIMGLCSMYEATLTQAYLDAANNVAQIEMDHQAAMAAKYPNQGGVAGQTGAFAQDRFNAWFDPSESTISGGGSPFMTALLCEGLIRLYWITGSAAVRDSILAACDWLADAAYDPASASFWYVCKDTATGTTPSLNPMWFQMLGFARQMTGDPKYASIASAVLAVNGWGNHIKEFNQGMRSSGQGLYLLQAPVGSAVMRWDGATGGAPPPPPPGGGGGGGGGCGASDTPSSWLLIALGVLVLSASRSVMRDA